MENIKDWIVLTLKQAVRSTADRRSWTGTVNDAANLRQSVFELTEYRYRYRCGVAAYPRRRAWWRATPVRRRWWRCTSTLLRRSSAAGAAGRGCRRRGCGRRRSAAARARPCATSATAPAPRSPRRTCRPCRPPAGSGTSATPRRAPAELHHHITTQRVIDGRRSRLIKHTRPETTRNPKVVWDETASPPDPLVTTAHNRSTVFARWANANRRFLEPTPVTVPNDSLIGFAVFAWPMPHSLHALHCATRDPHKFARSRGGYRPPLTRGIYLGLPDPPPKTASRSNQPFFQSTRSLTILTDGQINRPTDRKNMVGLYSACNSLTYSAWNER